MNKLYIFIIIYAIIALLVFTAKTNNLKEKMTALTPLPTLAPLAPNTTYYDWGCYNDTDHYRPDSINARKQRAFSYLYTKGTNNIPAIMPVNNIANTTTTTAKSDAAINNAKMVTTIEEAKKIAIDNGYNIFGIQAGGYLFLSNNITDAIQYNRTNIPCNIKKGINQSGWANHIWSTTQSTNTTINTITVTDAPANNPIVVTSGINPNDYISIGCYNEAPSTMPYNAMQTLDSRVSTLVDAKAIAANKKSPIFGLRSGGNLYLSADLSFPTLFGKVTNNNCITTNGLGIDNQNSIWVNPKILSDYNLKLYNILTSKTFIPTKQVVLSNTDNSCVKLDIQGNIYYTDNISGANSSEWKTRDGTLNYISFNSGRLYGVNYRDDILFKWDNYKLSQWNTISNSINENAYNVINNVSQILFYNNNLICINNTSNIYVAIQNAVSYTPVWLMTTIQSIKPLQSITICNNYVYGRSSDNNAYKLGKISLTSSTNFELNLVNISGNLAGKIKKIFGDGNNITNTNGDYLLAIDINNEVWSNAINRANAKFGTWVKVPYILRASDLSYMKGKVCSVDLNGIIHYDFISSTSNPPLPQILI